MFELAPHKRALQFFQLLTSPAALSNRPAMRPSIDIGGLEIPATRDCHPKILLSDRQIVGDARALAVEVTAPNKLPRICIMAHRADSQIGICPHKKIYNSRVGTTLRGDHARPPWSFVCAPSHVLPWIPLHA